jgi:multidrug resistance efflux pump
MKAIEAPSRSTSLKETAERGARSAERGEHHTSCSPFVVERSAWRTRVTRLIWVLGIFVFIGSVAGTGLILYSRAGDGAPGAGERAATAAEPSAASVVCFGHVDVEPGVTALYPVRPGRVTEVLVHEDDAVKAGTVLFRIDDRPARFLVRQAAEDLKSGELQLADARKLPEQHALKVAQQQQAVLATQHRLSAARHLLEHSRHLQKRELAPVEEVEAGADKVKELEAAETAESEKLRELKLIDPTLQIERAEADVRAKRARLEEAQYAVEECSVKAPVEGKVLRLLIGVGDVLSTQPRQPAIQFCPAGPRIVRAEVEQEFASRVEKGQIAHIQDDSSAGPSWRGKVARLSDWYTHRRSMLQEPLQFNDVRTLECIVELDPGQPTPRVGQRVRVTLGPAVATR